MNIKKRLLAILIDYLVLGIFMFLYITFMGVAMAFLKIAEYGETQATICQIVTLAFVFVYYAHPLRTQGQTLGEKVMKFKVVPANGEKISLWSALLRYVMFAPLLAVIGIFTKDKQNNISFLEFVTRTRQITIEDKEKA